MAHTTNAGETVVMANLELRAVPASESLTWAKVFLLAFGQIASDEETELAVDECFDPEWAIGVYDAGRLVATAGALDFELTLPAGPGQPFPQVPAVGVTAVGVLPTHRRRGLLNQMMAHQLGQLREREVPLAILLASEAVIYGRYGYGVASSRQSVAITTRRSDLLPTPSAGGSGPGRFRILDGADAADVLPAVHERSRRLRPGEVSRSKSIWSRIFLDPESDRGGAGARAYVAHEDGDGVPDGYVSYRKQFKWDGPQRAHTIAINDMYSASPDVHAALWRFLLDLDLVDEVQARSRPLDDPLRWLLSDPRQLRTTGIADYLWLLVVDVPAALATRGYGAETELVLEIQGPVTERYHLSTGPTSGHCRRAENSEKTDLILGRRDLGAIYLGGCRASVMAAAGRIQESRPGALARADAAFASPLAPFCGTFF